MNAFGRHIGFDVSPDGIAIVTMDMDGKGANVLDSEMIEELSAAVRRVHNSKDIKGVIFASGKPRQFIAGASIDEIMQIKDPTVAEEKARLGQDLMEAIEKLQVPSVAAIDGACLGGGLEFALACTYRIASDGNEVGFALPEVKLGIIPGFGGTQRLPELLGLVTALDMITSGRNIFPKKALSLGLIDDLCPRPLLLEIALQWAKKPVRARKARKMGFLSVFLEFFPPTRKLIYISARKKILSATQGNYPAPLRALDVIEKTFRVPDPYRYDLEAQKVGSLVASNISKSLVQLFLSTEKIRKSQFSLPPQPIKKVAILGAGTMGAGIAHQLALKDRWVRLRDVSEEPLYKAYLSIRTLLEKDKNKKRETPRWFENKLNHISMTTQFSGLPTSQMLIEAIVEKLDVKQQVLSECAKHLSQDAVIATNTSALSVSKIAQALPNPSRVIGLHFFNPVNKMPLVEIIQGEQTSVQTVCTTMNFAISIGKTPIVVADRPGFLVNRILGLYLTEAMRLAEDGYGIKAIEDCAIQFGLPMGPFELMDEVGIDISHHVGQYLAESFSYFPRPTHLLQTMIDGGRLGKKGKKGFYIHQKNKKKLDSEYVSKKLGLKSKVEHEDPRMVDIITDRMILVMVNESFRCLQEGIVQSEQDVNVGMILGTGFPPFRGGPIQFARGRGIQNIVARLQELASSFGEHFKPVQILLDEQNRSLK